MHSKNWYSVTYSEAVVSFGYMNIHESVISLCNEANYIMFLNYLKGMDFPHADMLLSKTNAIDTLKSWLHV